MTIIEAISQSLCDIKHPATYQEVYEHIVEKNYFEFGAKSPISVVRVKLRLHSDNVKIKSGEGKTKYFHSESGEGKNETFSLLEDPIQDAVSTPNKVNKIKSASVDSVVRDDSLFESLNRWYSRLDLSIHKSSCIECFWMLLGSFLPIIVDSFLRCALLSIPFVDAVRQNLKSGEVFLLTSALIMPFFCVLINYMRSDDEYKCINNLPYFGWVFIFTLGSLLLGTLTFIYYRIGQLVRSEAESEIVKAMFSFDFGNWAIFIFIISLLVWYYSSYMGHRSTDKYKKIRQEQQKKLENGFNSIGENNETN